MHWIGSFLAIMGWSHGDLSLVQTGALHSLKTPPPPTLTRGLLSLLFSLSIHGLERKRVEGGLKESDIKN